MTPTHLTLLALIPKHPQLYQHLARNYALLPHMLKSAYRPFSTVLYHHRVILPRAFRFCTTRQRSRPRALQRAQHFRQRMERHARVAVQHRGNDVWVSVRT